MKNLFVLFCSVCIGLSIIATTLRGIAEENLSTIKCEIVDDSEVSIKIKGYPFPPNKEKKQSKYDLVLVIDNTNKKVMNMYKNDQEFKEPKVENDSISFHRVTEYKTYKSDIFMSINRLTGGLYGLGHSSDDNSNATMSTYHSLKGTCSPYKIEKKF